MTCSNSFRSLHRQNHRWRHRSQQDPHARSRRGGDRPVGLTQRLYRLRHLRPGASALHTRRSPPRRLRSQKRGKHIVCRVGHTRRYTSLASGLRAITALVVLRNKAIKPLLAADRALHLIRGGLNPKPIDAHYHALRFAMQGIFHELGIAA